jgi:hypothetical protein
MGASTSSRQSGQLMVCTTAALSSSPTVSLARDPVVFSVVADPKPENAVIDVNAESPIMEADPTGPESSDALEAKRWVARVGFEKLVLLICQLLNRLLQAPVTGPKLRRSEVPQNSVDFAAA